MGFFVPDLAVFVLTVRVDVFRIRLLFTEALAFALAVFGLVLLVLAERTFTPFFLLHVGQSN